METDNNNKIIEESPEENNVQVEDHPDNFSDQEEDDDFYKIQVENFKNKTAKDFHKNIILIDEKGREIHSAKFSSVHPKNFKKKSKKTSKKEQPQETPVQPVQERLILNNSSGLPENSTTINENLSAGLQRNPQSQNEEKSEDEKKEEKESSEDENEENEE